MLDTLSDRFNSAFRSLSGRGKISESNVRDAMRDVRTALLEADVHLDVVKKFCDEVVQDAMGEKVMESLKPGQQMIEIVNRRLVELMGPVESHLMLVEPGPTVVMMCGLQGSGKTTTCGKLAALLKRQGKRVLVVAADLQRPAAVEQLKNAVFAGLDRQVLARPAAPQHQVAVVVLLQGRACPQARLQAADLHRSVDARHAITRTRRLHGSLDVVRRQRPWCAKATAEGKLTSATPHHLGLNVPAATHF